MKMISSEYASISPQELISQIRSDFISAPLGEFPSVRRIMKNLNLLNLPNLSVETVQSIASKEEWQELRNQNIEEENSFDKQELTALIRTRNLDLYKMLFNEIKAIHRLNTEYAATGKAMSLNGRSELKGYKIDLGGLASLTQAISEIFKSTHISQVFIDKLSLNKTDVRISSTIRAYFQTISKMSEDDLVEEIQRLDKLITMLDKQCLSKEDIEMENSMSGSSLVR